MKYKLRLISIVISLITASGAVLATAGAASAASQCNSEGLNGGGQVCVNYDPQGYQAKLIQSGSSNGDYMDFNLSCNNGRVFGDRGSFLAYAYNTYTYVFAVGSEGTCHVIIYDRSSGGQASSPSVTR